MLDTYAVAINTPGAKPIRIGPFIAPSNAERYAERLRSIAAARHLQADIATVPTNRGLDHLDARLPTDPWSLERLLTEEENRYGDEIPFPDVHTRLIVQIGQERAEELRDRATGWTTAAAGDDEARRTELTERAEDVREQRDQAVATLRGIAVELWHAGLRNKNDLHAITGLSRATIYDALRDAGIDPTDREK